MRIRTALTGLLITGAAALPFASHADNPNYTYADLGYASINDPGNSGLKSDHAYGLDGSYALTPNWVLQGSYAHESADTVFSGESVSGNLYAIGVGYRFPLNDNWDFFPSLNYDSQHASASGPLPVNAAATFNGYDASLLFRGMLTDKLELDPGYDYSHLTASGFPDISTDTLLVHGFYDFTPNFALGLGYENASNSGSSTNTWKVLFRYNFR